MFKRLIQFAIFTAAINLSSFYSAYAANSLSSQDTSDIVFIKSDHTLGNTRTFGLVIEDIDLDNDFDIFICNYIGTSRLWLNDGYGHFTMSGFNSISAEVHDADIADLNGDSLPDIFIVNHNAPNKVYFNNGSGGFTASVQNIGSSNESPETIQLEDIDGDDDKDALIYNIDAPNRIWLNNGNGIFTMTSHDYGGSDANGMKLADFNADSFPDLLICFRTQQNQLWMNNGSGVFTNTGQELGGDAEDLDIADIDGDGDSDILSVGSNISIWLNQNNTGTFSAGSNIQEEALRCNMFDADLDGDFDLATAHIISGNLLWLNDGSGNFTLHSPAFGNVRVLSIDSEDFDGDGDFDVVLGQLEGSGGNSIYFNESILSGIEQNISGSTNFILHNNYPNPFNPATIIRYSIPVAALSVAERLTNNPIEKRSQNTAEGKFVTLKIYDILGREVSSLVNEEQSPGYYEVKWDATGQASGVYFYKLSAGAFSKTKKMILLE